MFHGKHNLFLLVLNEKSGKDSKIEFHSFKYRCIVKDSYSMHQGEFGVLPDRIHRSYSFSGCLNNKASLLGSGKENHREHQQLGMNKTEKILEYQFQTPVKRISFCLNLRLLIVAFVSGIVEGYELSVDYERKEHNNESEDDEDENMRMEDKEERTHGTVILTRAFEQIDDENPRRRKHRHNSKDPSSAIQNEYKVEVDYIKMVQYFSSYMRLYVHKAQINDMCID
mmetsp:Transcript_13141/g.9525  ORF Transcript_13141/g.9525 Transcript_13141/m.9525 type:complete len:226 (+) Transcript_13141:423-1100(+)